MQDWRKSDDADRGMNGNAPLAKGFMKEDTTTRDEYVQGIEAAVSELEETLRDCIGQLGQLKAMVTQIQAEGPEEQLLNIEGIARYLQVPVYTARQMANQKGFPLIKIGKHIRADLNDVKIWARTHLNKEVDATVYESYNKECDGRIDPQKNQKENETDPSPARQKAGSRRQYGCAVGAG